MAEVIDRVPLQELIRLLSAITRVHMLGDLIWAGIMAAEMFAEMGTALPGDRS